VTTETLALFEHLEFGFLTEYTVFAPRRAEANTGSSTIRTLPKLLALLLQEYLRYAAYHL